MSYGHIMYVKVCKPDNFKSHNSLKVRFTDIRCDRPDFADCADCESFLESNSRHILVLCETNLDDSIDSGNFSVRGYLQSERIPLLICMVLQSM